MTDDGGVDVEVDCQLCGTSASVADLSMARLEFLLDTWTRLHEHTPGERAAYYGLLAAAADDDGGEPDGGYR